MFAFFVCCCIRKPCRRPSTNCRIPAKWIRCKNRNNLEEIQNHDIDEWSGIARDTGAINVNYVADFSAGKITFDIEYKRPFSYTKYCEWLIYPIALSILTASLKFL